MQDAASDLARIRYENALVLFDEFVRATARQADAATLRGLEGRFAERLQIQPSYWSQIKGRSRQIGERLARQFEQLSHKPAGWMDRPHRPGADAAGAPTGPVPRSPGETPGAEESAPRDADERFIVGLVLTYYRRHPQRARTRLLELLGEVLVTPSPSPSPMPAPAKAKPGAATPRSATGRAAAGTVNPLADDGSELWTRTRAAVAPLKRKR